jgi:hypothetical protein
MWRLWQGDLWRDIVALWTLWGMVVAFIQRLRTHQWRWTKKTLLYALLGSFLIIGGAVAYQMYRDELHNFVLQNLNAKHTQISSHQQVSVQPQRTLPLLAGTVENPIQLCRSDKALLIVEASPLDEVFITFPTVGGQDRRDPIRLRVGGQYVHVNEEGKRVTENEALSRDVREMAEPLELPPLLVLGLNHLHFDVEPYQDPHDTMALSVKFLHNSTEQLIRAWYGWVPRTEGSPTTDIYFNVEPCGKEGR